MTDEPQDALNAEAADVPTGGKPSKDACTMAMLMHLLGIVTGFVGPLIIWMIKKDEDVFIDDQGKEALNFQITVVIAYLISGALTFVCIGFFMIPAIAIAVLVFSIIAGLKANEGVAYRYPLTIRLIK